MYKTVILVLVCQVFKHKNFMPLNLKYIYNKFKKYKTFILARLHFNSFENRNSHINNNIKLWINHYDVEFIIKVNNLKETAKIVFVVNRLVQESAKWVIVLSCCGLGCQILCIDVRQLYSRQIKTQCAATPCHSSRWDVLRHLKRVCLDLTSLFVAGL